MQQFVCLNTSKEPWQIHYTEVKWSFINFGSKHGHNLTMPLWVAFGGKMVQPWSNSIHGIFLKDPLAISSSIYTLNLAKIA